MLPFYHPVHQLRVKGFDFTQHNLCNLSGSKFIKMGMIIMETLWFDALLAYPADKDLKT